MYISVPDDDSGLPSFYNCFKCGSSGIVTHNSLIAWGIYDKDIAFDLIEYNRSIMNNPRSSGFFGRLTYQIRNNYTTLDDKSEEKRQYIVERLGIDLSFEDLKNLKVSLNLLDLLKENSVEKFSRSPNIIKDLDREFIGFISIDNAYMNMRRTCEAGMVYKEIDKKYINYQIFNKFSTEERFYTIPTVVDLNKPQQTNIHIAEGPFDILSIYLNLRHKEEGIYTSIAGNNPVTTLLYFLSTLKLPYVNIHYYADNDKYGRAERVKYILKRVPDYQNHPVYLHRNISPDEKDFGVPISRIKESIIPLNL